MSAFDPRTTPARGDLAAAHLKGKVKADRFVEGVIHHVIAATAPLRHAPAPDAPLDTETLHGEEATIYEADAEGWCWGQLKGDGYVGYLPAAALAPGATGATHRVIALRTFVFPAPDIKTPPIAALPFASRVKIVREEKSFGVADDGGFIPLCHLAPLATLAPDFVATARRFIGAPYLWGGRSDWGLDCSGFVQAVHGARGVVLPRDSDQQFGSGRAVPVTADGAGYHSGDLLFFTEQGGGRVSHVAMWVGAGRIAHATLTRGGLVTEDLFADVPRLRRMRDHLVGVRRVG